MFSVVLVRFVMQFRKEHSAVQFRKEYLNLSCKRVPGLVAGTADGKNELNRNISGVAQHISQV